ncbi:hypothetical protein DWU98_20960 [Dyella monticola]|uniref:Uncharacterized protein n=2 Tax=Dyella monticola TaxID=1927958 RepID=A0A370WS30_9GAMM|nr:hypothetical protein DWU98_20960 [Dyella monticola]
MGIFFVSFKKLSFDRIDNDQGTTLVGRQLENAKNQKGVLGVVDGVHILRITPSYLVSMDMPFFSTAPKEARDDIIKDMVNLVESVHVMTSP